MSNVALARGLRVMLTAIALVASSASPALAQFEGFLEKVTDINIFASCWNTGGDLDRSNCPGRNGYGIEVLWNLGRFPTSPGPVVQKPTQVDVRYGQVARGQGGDSVTVLLDSTITYQVTTPATAADNAILLEVALGYSQFSGFGSEDSRYHLDGAVREIPSLTLYASFPNRIPVVTPYLGLRTGLIELRNAQLYDRVASDTVAVYSGTAQAFQLGLVAGGAVPSLVIPRTQFTAEVAYHLRRFPSVQWAKDGARTPSYFPRSLDFSGFSFSLGAQISLRDKP
jgi:hypothetical protein